MLGAVDRDILRIGSDRLSMDWRSCRNAVEHLQQVRQRHDTERASFVARHSHVPSASEEWDAVFGADMAAVDRVLNWLRKQGEALQSLEHVDPVWREFVGERLRRRAVRKARRAARHNQLQRMRL